MKITDVHQIVNSMAQELLGETAVVNEDLSNIVDIGQQILNLEDGYDKYVKSIVNKIGKTIFVNRVYKGQAPSVLMDEWTYGSILEKVRADIPEATTNEMWALEKGGSYDENIFNPPTVHEKFFNQAISFDIDISYTREQVEMSLTSASQLNGFIGMIEQTVQNGITINLNNLIKATIANAIGETLASDYPEGDYNAKSGIKAVNLLHLYNTRKGTALTPTQAMQDPDFLRFSAITISEYQDRLSEYSTLFNCTKTAKFTPKDLQHVVLLSEFKHSVEGYMQSETFHNELVQLPSSETVACWQGTGTDYGFSSTSAIDIQLASDKMKTVQADGIVGVIFDRDCLGVCNKRLVVNTHHNGKGDFTNYFYHVYSRYFNDLDENCVVFFIK